ncbi:UNVERIFIED_CONTAM: hypothetical protein PYX00_007408 [Menopon gallinae]|uniref:Uncharacterized protein n=1 Tax=Menopon gallinae TaxID=328185 RepID=A0AAW2HIZ5_9NEOP
MLIGSFPCSVELPANSFHEELSEAFREDVDRVIRHNFNFSLENSVSLSVGKDNQSLQRVVDKKPKTDGKK